MKLMCLVLLLLTSCVGANTETIKKNGDYCTASYVSVFRDVKGLDFTVCHAEGKVIGTKVNTESVRSIQTIFDMFKGGPR